MGVPVTGTHANAENNGQEGAPDSYNLPKGKWQANFGYRHFRAFRHFVGDVEQNAENVANGTAESDRAGTNVINHVHQPMVGITYGVTDRLSVSADGPYFQGGRRGAHARGPAAGPGSRPPLPASATRCLRAVTG